jgi:hypothetical protein
MNFIPQDNRFMQAMPPAFARFLNRAAKVLRLILVVSNDTASIVTPVYLDAQALQWRETLVDCPEKFSALELSKGNQQKVAFPMGRKGYALKWGKKFVRVFLCHNQVPCFDSCVRG